MPGFGAGVWDDDDRGPQRESGARGGVILEEYFQRSSKGQLNLHFRAFFLASFGTKVAEWGGTSLGPLNCWRSEAPILQRPLQCYPC